MYFARTLLVPVLLIGGLVEVASAQHQYIFPQFAFGGGWESTLMVQASDTPTTCTFSAQDRFFTMRNPSGSNLSGTSISLTFGMNGWTILKTATPQGMAVSSGMAVLDCSEEVSANTLFSLEVGGSLVAEAVVESAEEIVSGVAEAQFLADHRDGARFGVAVANPSNQPINVSIRVAGLDGQQIANTTVNGPANAAQAFFVDELVTIPTGHTGQVLLGATGSAYVVGLRFSGLVFTTIPATIIPATRVDTTPPSTSLAPENEPAFHRLVVGQRMVPEGDPDSYVDFVSPGRFSGAFGLVSGSYTYQNTGPDTGTLTLFIETLLGLDVSGSPGCAMSLVFTSTTTGTATVIPSPSCESEALQGNWYLTPTPN